MANLFSCDPDCTLGELAAAEWLVIVLLFVVIVIIVSLLRKWAFEWNKIPEATLLWHVPRFLFISFVVLVTTVPVVSVIVGRDIGYLYGKVGAPVVCIVVYLVWLLMSDMKIDDE